MGSAVRRRREMEPMPVYGGDFLQFIFNVDANGVVLVQNQRRSPEFVSVIAVGGRRFILQKRR